MAVLDKNGNLRGTLGDVVYRHVNGKNVAQSRPRSQNRTAKTIKASVEFGLTSNTACTMRQVLAGIFNWSDGQMGNRLMGLVRKAFNNSESAGVNERDFHDSDLSFLPGFQFNNRSPLTSMMKPRPVISTDESGALDFYLAPVSIKRDLVMPKSALSVKCAVRVSLILFNFREDYYEILEQRETDIKTKEMEEINWHFDPSIPDGCALLVFLSLQYYVDDALQGRKSINSEQLNPVELVGAYQYWQGRKGTAATGISPEQLSLPGYRGNQMLHEYALGR